MREPYDLRLLILALSGALGTEPGEPGMHARRIGCIAVACGRQLGWSPKALSLLFHASLLRDCGLPGMTARRRHRHGMNGRDVDGHSQAGARLLARSTLLAPLAALVRHHHTPWQELAQDGEAGEMARLGHLVCLAEYADAYLAAVHEPPVQALDSVIRRALQGLPERLFMPNLTDALLAVAATEAFRRMFDHRHFQAYLRDVLSGLPAQPVDLAGVRDLAQFFAQVADSRNAYMAGHSTRVGKLAAHLGELAGMSVDECARLEIAGLLHDLGKLQVADELLDKTGSLTAEERIQLNRQGLAAYRIIRQAPGLERIATWIAYQHTTGAVPAPPGPSRPRREANILAVAEAFQAMLQARPYRQPMTPLRAVSLLRQRVDLGQLDGAVVDLLAGHVNACWTLASGVEVDAWGSLPGAGQPRSDEDAWLVEAVLAGGIHIPPMPAVLHDLARLRGNPDAGPREFAALINKDVALAGAIFRIANSPVFRRSIRVDTIEKAVAVLGLKYSEAVITSEAMRQSLSDPNNGKAMEVLWGHLSAVAELCVGLCSRLRIPGVTPENAYMVGMFHDCGVALLCKRHPDYANALIRNGVDADIPSLDREFWNSHTLLGQTVGRNWQLPPEFIAVIRHHHDRSMPPLPDPADKLIALLQLALHIEKRQRGCDDAEWVAGWQGIVEDRLAVGEETVARLIEDLSCQPA